MKLSTRTRYGSRALVEIALGYPERAICVREIAQNQRISPKYLEQIIAELKLAGLVRPIRGMHGGYTLTRPPDRINLREVFDVLEGSVAPVDCVDQPDICSFRSACPTRGTWVAVKAAITDVLERTSLQDLVDNKAEGETADPVTPEGLEACS